VGVACYCSLAYVVTLPHRHVTCTSADLSVTARLTPFLFLHLPQVPRPEGRKFVKRQIRHPHFLNESVQEVAAQVAALPPGECRMRPSVKGPQMLGLTLKLHESPGQDQDDPPLHIIKHFDIKEVRGRATLHCVPDVCHVRRAVCTPAQCSMCVGSQAPFSLMMWLR
jgi:hypothetical protein